MADPAGRRGALGAAQRVEWMMSLNAQQFDDAAAKSSDRLRNIEMGMRAVGTIGVQQFNQLNQVIQALNKNAAALKATLAGMGPAMKGMGGAPGAPGGPPGAPPPYWTPPVPPPVIPPSGGPPGSATPTIPAWLTKTVGFISGFMGVGSKLLELPARADVLLEGLSTRYGINKGNAAASRLNLFNLRDQIGGNTSIEEAAGAYQNYAQMTRRGGEELGGLDVSRNRSMFGQSAYRMSRSLGIDMGAAGGSIGDIGKTINADVPSMDQYTKRLSGIQRESSLAGDQIARMNVLLAQQAAQYGKSGQEALSYMGRATQVGSALANVGMNMDAVFGAARQGDEGSDEAFLNDLLLGFNPNEEITDTKRAERMIERSKEFAGSLSAGGTNLNSVMGNMLLGQLGGSMGLRGFSPGMIKQANMNAGAFKENVNRVGAAGDVGEVAGTDRVYDSIVRGFSEAARKAEKGLFGVGDAAYEAIGGLQDLATKMAKWAGELSELSSTTRLLLAGGASAAGGVAGSMGMGLLGKIFGGAAGPATAGGSAALVTGAVAASATAIVLTVVTGAAIGGLIGYLINKYVLKNEQKEAVGDFLLYGAKGRSDEDPMAANREALLARAAEAVRNKDFVKAAQFRQLAAGTKAPQGARSAIGIEDTVGSAEGYKSPDAPRTDFGNIEGLTPDLLSLIKDLNLYVTHGKESKGHNVGSEHGLGIKADVRTSHMTEAQKKDLARAVVARGGTYRDESERPEGQDIWGGSHGEIRLGKGRATSAASTGRGSATGPSASVDLSRARGSREKMSAISASGATADAITAASGVTGDAAAIPDLSEGGSEGSGGASGPDSVTISNKVETSDPVTHSELRGLSQAVANMAKAVADLATRMGQKQPAATTAMTSYGEDAYLQRRLAEG